MAKGIYIRTRYFRSSLRAYFAFLNAYNSIASQETYTNEASIILLTNAIELLFKAVLLKKGKKIEGKSKNETIPAEKCISKLLESREVDKIEAQSLQQIVSLRNAAIHSYFPSDIPAEVMHHLAFFGSEIFKRVISSHFPLSKKALSNDRLALSVAGDLTYADTIESLLRKFSSATKDQKRLIWLLENGISYDGKGYLSQEQFEKQFFASKKRILSRVQIGKYLNQATMNKIILVQAPRNMAVDVSLRKGDSGRALPVVIKKTDINSDYPYSASDLGRLVSKNKSFIGKLVRKMSLLNDSRYHQAIKVGKSEIHKYSGSALAKIQEKLRNEPEYNPWQ